MVNYQERYVAEEVKIKHVDYILIKRLLGYLHPYRFWVITAVLLLIISRAIEAWIPIQLGYLTQMIMERQFEPTEEKGRFFTTILQGCLWILGWVFFNYLLDIFNILIKNWIGQKAIFKLRTQVYRHIEHLPMSFYDHAAIGRLMTRTIHDVDQINQLFSESVIPLIGSLVLFVGIWIGIFTIDWRIGVLFCFIFPLIWGLVHYFRVHQRSSYNMIRSILSAMNAFIQELLMGINIVRSFGLQSVEKKKFEELNEDHLQANLKTVKYFSLFFSGVEFLQNLTMISVFIILISFTPLGSTFQAGTYFTISVYSLMIFRPLLDLAERYNILQSAMAASERVFEILDSPLEPIGAQPGLPLNGITSIIFKDVWFAYEKENWILRGVSFTVKQGESLALVGVTGSGKTSIMNLLLRLYDFQKGKILINDRDILDYSISDVRKQFSVILQDPVIFSGTIFDNIALYDPTIDRKLVEESAKYVNLNVVVDRFQNRFDHVLKERGTSLSVGENQLIALARAVAHQRSMLIFDEATANIDSHTEKMIQDALHKILTDKTAIVIAHRLSTIQNVTRILVLREGRVAESGTHAELLKSHGLYQKLYQLQFTSAIDSK